MNAYSTLSSYLKNTPHHKHVQILNISGFPWQIYVLWSPITLYKGLDWILPERGPTRFRKSKYGMLDVCRKAHSSDNGMSFNLSPGTPCKPSVNSLTLQSLGRCVQHLQLLNKLVIFYLAASLIQITFCPLNS